MDKVGASVSRLIEAVAVVVESVRPMFALVVIAALVLSYKLIEIVGAPTELYIFIAGTVLGGLLVLAKDLIAGPDPIFGVIDKILAKVKS